MFVFEVIELVWGLGFGYYVEIEVDVFLLTF